MKPRKPLHPSDSTPRLLPKTQRAYRTGRDLERFVNLWRIALVGALTVVGLVNRATQAAPAPEWEVALEVLGTLLVFALGFQFYLAWFNWDERMGMAVAVLDVLIVMVFLAGCVARDRAIVATNSQVGFLIYFVALALAGARSNPLVSRTVALLVPVSYGVVVFLAVAWRQVQYALPDPVLGSFRWEVQAARIVILITVTLIIHLDVATDATARAEALRDPLTGAFNRRYLEEFLSRQIPRSRRRQQPLSLVLVDLDGFKSFNDTHGHLEGDRLLRQVASSLMAAVRSGDVVARYGGDEFVVVLPNTPGETARRVARELSEAVPPQVGLSAGVSCIGGSVQEAVDLLASADAALMKAKQTGRGIVIAGPIRTE